MTHRTILLGIAGDSAAGKTTFSQGIVKLFDDSLVTGICCDNYHRYSREIRNELGISALEPEGNYLDIAEQHFRLLREGQPILMPTYNHETGELGAPLYVRPAKYVIVEGLLPFHTESMRRCFDVLVYLDPPEELRYAWKVRRDTTMRGYTKKSVVATLEKRKHLSPLYIHPQRQKADVIVQFYPSEERNEETGHLLNVRLAFMTPGTNGQLTNLFLHNDSDSQPAITLESGSYNGRQATILEFTGGVTAGITAELRRLIKSYLPPATHLNMDQLGVYQWGLVLRRSYTLAVSQMVVAYLMVSAGAAAN